MDLTRAGGFTSFLQDPDAMPTFTHFSSQPPPFSPYPGFPFAHAPFPLFCTQPPAQPPVTAMASGAGSSRSGPTRRVTATPEAVDDGRGRMYYTQDEDLRLVSAWLNNSTDPIAGNARKGETYWSKVAETYNATTPADRKREMHHLKGHWHKTTKKVSFFNGCYIQLRDSYASGRSDDQLMEQALELYRTPQGHPFTYQHWWRAVAESPKWNVHVSSGGSGPKKHTPDLNRDPAPTERPMGIKRAKKGKGTTDEVVVVVKEHLKALVDVQSTQKEEMDGIMEVQQKLADQRVQAADLQLKAAQEKKEGKLLDHKNKLLEKFTELLQVDTSKMEPWAKEAHVRAVTLLSDQLWGRVDTSEAA